LFAVGVRPARIVASGWPAALGIALVSALASAAWGREASSPGRAVRAMLTQARDACAAAPPPATADVPLLGVSWVCLPGEPPRAILPVGRGALSASSLVVSDDLRALDASDRDLILPALPSGTEGGASPEARVHARAASVRGLLPLAPASNLGPAARAALLAVSTTALSAVAGALALAAALRARAAALALGAAGPAAALLVFSALERAPSPPAAYAAVPIAGLAALLVAYAVARRASPGAA
jgi:hypothetical protein